MVGKVDWFAAGLPREGESAGVPRLGDLARSHVPVCRLDDRVGDIRRTMDDLGVCLVLNAEGVLLGAVRAVDLDPDDDETAAAVMREGPSTYRPDVELAEMADRVRRRPTPRIVVTDPDGRLIGVVATSTLEAAVADLGPDRAER